jgi:hypothetical protein
VSIVRPHYKPNVPLDGYNRPERVVRSSPYDPCDLGDFSWLNPSPIVGAARCADRLLQGARNDAAGQTRVTYWVTRITNADRTIGNPLGYPRSHANDVAAPTLETRRPRRVLIYSHLASHYLPLATRRSSSIAAIISCRSFGPWSDIISWSERRLATFATTASPITYPQSIGRGFAPLR